MLPRPQIQYTGGHMPWLGVLTWPDLDPIHRRPCAVAWCADLAGVRSSTRAAMRRGLVCLPGRTTRRRRAPASG